MKQKSEIESTKVKNAVIQKTKLTYQFLA